MHNQRAQSMNIVFIVQEFHKPCVVYVRQCLRHRTSGAVPAVLVKIFFVENAAAPAFGQGPGGFVLPGLKGLHDAGQVGVLCFFAVVVLHKALQRNLPLARRAEMRFEGGACIALTQGPLVGRLKNGG